MESKSFKDLIVWQRSMELSAEIYRLCKLLPKDEIYGLSSQMKRAVVSIPSNIAEGYKRRNVGEYLYFCGIADGSAAELETQLLLTSKLFATDTKLAMSLLMEIQKMLHALIKKLNAKR